jgi:hypothetical protein
MQEQPLFPDYQAKFKAEVDALLLGYYIWFPNDVLHVTLRALVWSHAFIISFASDLPVQQQHICKIR